jgi:RHS repeat-associated protein
LQGEKQFVPFGQPGQYEDAETGLCYNRFRYYDSGTGAYISQDPIGLAGGSRVYEYSKNTNLIFDLFGLLDFYHATNGSSSTNAVMNGIDPSKGRPNLDFNPANQGGFYVTNDLAQAQEWVKNDGAIIHFDVPEEELAKLKIKTFDGATDEWADFVTKGRGGELTHSFDAVEGPMVAKSSLGTAKIKAIHLQPDNRIGHQLALFSDDAAKLFDKYNKGKVNCH